MTRARFATRSGFVASPSAAGSSPKASQSRCHSPSLPTAICTEPSRQWKRPYGAIDGWWLPADRPTSPATVQRVPWKACTPTTDASSEVRTTRAHARPVAFVERGDDAVGAVHPGQQVGDRHADALRVVGPGAGERHEAGLALGDLVVAGAAALGPVVTEAGDRQHDEARVARHQRLDAEAKPVEHAGAEVLDEHVGPVDEGEQHVAVFGGLEVEGDRLLVAVGRQEVRRLAPPLVADEGRPPAAGVVAAARRLDLDDAGALVGEHHRRVRPGEGS